MLTEGYRWTGYGAIHFWQTQDVGEGQYDANAPRAVFCRQWDWTFGSGQTVERTLRHLQRHATPTIRSRSPGRLNVNGKQGRRRGQEYRVPAGGNREVRPARWKCPAARYRVRRRVRPVAGRQGRGSLQGRQGRLRAETGTDAAATAELAEGTARLRSTGRDAGSSRQHKLPFTSLTRPGLHCPTAARCWSIGKDALDAEQSTSSRLAAYAAGGRR